MQNFNKQPETVDNWTTEELSTLSHSLAHGYFPGLLSSSANAKDDDWTPEKLAQLGRNLADTYLP